MAARTDGEGVPVVFGLFHQKCGDNMVLSEGRRSRVATGRTRSIDLPPIAFSNNPIPKGVQFSVKVLQESKLYVSFPIQTSCSLQCMPCLDSAHRTESTRNSSRVVRCR